MIQLPERLSVELRSKPETGMGYQIVTVVLIDGRRFDQTVVVEGWITAVRGQKNIPFTADQIAEVTLTHEKWDFNREESHGSGRIDLE